MLDDDGMNMKMTHKNSECAKDLNEGGNHEFEWV